MDYLKELEQEIEKRSFDNKKYLQKYLEQVLHVIKYNEEAKKFFIEKGLFSIEDPSQKKFYDYFFTFYDKTQHKESELKIDDITTFVVDGVDYIKYRDKDGDYKVIENSDPNKSYIEQIEEKQKTSLDFQVGNSVDNTQAVLNKLTEERREVELESTVDPSMSTMTPEERAYFETLVNHELFKDKNLIYNASDNIYIDKDTGETYYVAVNSSGEKEIKKVNESYSLNNNDSINSSTTDNAENSRDEETYSNIDYSSFTDGDLYYLIENADSNIPNIEIEKAKQEIKKRETKAKQELELSKVSKPKQYVLDIKKPYNGFTSIMTLSLITILYGIGFMLYLYLLVK